MSWLSTAIGIFFLIFFPLKFLAWIDFEDRTAAAPSDLAVRAEEFWSAAAVNAKLNGYLQILSDDNVLVSKAFGQGATEDTQYQIGSLSKQFTAALVMQMEADGKLKRSDTVCKYIKTFCQGELSSITLEHLLTHVSGLGSFPFSIGGFVSVYAQFFKVYNLHELVSLQSHILWRKPGERFDYSNFGYDVLAAVIEKVSARQSFSDAMNDYFVNIPRLANTRFATEGVYRNFFGSGAIASTPNDMAKWGMLLLKQKMFREETLREYWKPALKEYAKGWIVDQNQVSKETIVWHNGKVPGYFSAMAIYPESKLVVVWLSNSVTSSNEEKRVSKEFDRLLFGKPYALPSARRTIPTFRF